jgi:hypothetical protein
MDTMKRASLIAALGLALTAAVGLGSGQPATSAVPSGVTSRTAQLAELLGFADGKLVRLDPETLRSLPGPEIAVGPGGCAPRSGGTACWSNPAWTISPDATRIAVARNDRAAVHLVKVAGMRVAGSLTWRFDGGSVGAIGWLGPTRIVGIQEAFAERQRVIAFDLATKRIVARRALGGKVIQLGRTARELVLLVAPAESIGTARLAVVDAKGRVRFVPLPEVSVGSKLLGTGSDHRVEMRTPGLTVDPLAGRAFVITEGLAAEVDLRTLAVSYHSLEEPRSLLSRFWNWLEPAADAKQVSGYHRQARWLGNDLIGVSGSDTEQGRFRPVGLQLVDTRTWSVRTIDDGATGFDVAGDSLLATGWSVDEATKRTVGIGLAAYGMDGEKRFHLLAGQHAWVALVHDGRAYVGIGAEPLRIVDLSTGLVVGTREQPLPALLLGTGSGWWG